LLAAENRFLEMLATRTPLGEILDRLCRSIEAQASGVLCSVLLLDPDGQHLRHGAAPSLPASYVQAIDGVCIGPTVGSCGTAAYKAAPVFVADIASDPLWNGYRELALPLGLRACWSTPFTTASGQVLGTFALYCRQPRLPSPDELHLLGRATYLTGLAVERHRLEESLLRREQRFRTLVEKSSDSFALLNVEGTVLYASPSTTRTLGYPADEFIGCSAFDLVHHEDAPAARAFLEECLRRPGEGIAMACRCRHHDGSWRHIEGIGCSRFDDPSVQALVLNYRDITERKKAEEALRASEERLRHLLEKTHDIISLVDAEGIIRHQSSSLERVLGHSPRQHVGKSFWSFLSPEESEGALAELAGLLQRPGATLTLHHCVHHADGTLRMLESVAHNLLHDPHVQGMVIHSRDVTERQRGEERLRSSEAKYRSLVENLEQCVFLKDTELRFVTANRRFCASLGRVEAELVGCTDFDFYPHALAEKYRTGDRLVLAEGRRVELEEEHVTGGRKGTVRVIKTPVKDDQGTIVGVLGIFWDVTEQRNLEEQLRQAQKMEAVGQLAGGVAHDFNNLLTAILGNVSLLGSTLPGDHPGHEWVRAVETAALRAATLTRQLLGFSRHMLFRSEPVDLSGVIVEVVGLLRSTIDPRIHLEVPAAEGLWPVQGDPSQLNQVLMNLCLNARDALPAGGRIVLAAENVQITGEYCRLHLEARQGDFVRLRVRDTGSGIPPEVMPRIFEPFFTTKGPGKGTGLGLAMVFGIVKQHRGWIDCSSEMGHGTCFDIYIPRAEQTPGPDPAPVPGDPAAAGDETILLVDDELSLRQLGQTTLSRCGYHVLLAEDGAQAVEVFRQEWPRIDLVILDLTMPRLSGVESFHEMVAINPNVRVLFASGYAADQVLPGRQEAILGFVSKPYGPDELARRVRAALDQAKARCENNASDR
jgi:PAS domain S-box-containing protein